MIVPKTGVENYVNNFTTVQDVQIVRSKMNVPQAIGTIIGEVGGKFLKAWLIMLLVPVATAGVWLPGYWQSFAGVLIASMLVGVRDEYKMWTKGRK